jgi:hypothetical protein
MSDIATGLFTGIFATALVWLVSAMIVGAFYIKGLEGLKIWSFFRFLMVVGLPIGWGIGIAHVHEHHAIGVWVPLSATITFAGTIYQRKRSSKRRS